MNYCTPDDIVNRLYYCGRSNFWPTKPTIEVQYKNENFSQLIFDFTQVGRVSKNQEIFDVYTGNDETKKQLIKQNAEFAVENFRDSMSNLLEII